MKAPAEMAVTFECRGARLVGVFHEAAHGHAGKPGILVVVGGPQYRVGSHRQFVLMGRDLAAAGYPVLRFDYRGMGDSEGDSRPFDQVGDDIDAAIDALMGMAPTLPGVVLWGLCDGASAVLIHAYRSTRVVGLIVANPWVRTEQSEARSYVRNYYAGRVLQRDFWRKLLRFEVDVFRALAGFLRALRTGFGGPGHARREPEVAFLERMRRGFEAYAGPCLVVLSGRDLTADQFRELAGDDARWTALLARPHVSILTLDGADHTFSAARAQQQLNSAMLAWLEESWPGAGEGNGQVPCR